MNYIDFPGFLSRNDHVKFTCCAGLVRDGMLEPSLLSEQLIAEIPTALAETQQLRGRVVLDLCAGF